MENKIGTDAGLVWEALHKASKPLALKDLKKKAGIRTEKEVWAAVGWLAKEGKLNFKEEDSTIYFSLK